MSFVRINGERYHFWRAFDHEGEVPKSLVTKTRDKKAALKFPKKAMRRHGPCKRYVTDKLRSYGAAMKGFGVEDRYGTGRWVNNRAENSHLPFRQKERCSGSGACEVFRSSPPSPTITNHFDIERSLASRHLFKANRAAALAEWRGLCAA